MRASGRLPSLLVTAGSFGGAASQWLLVWLFARSGGTAAVGVYSGLLAIATPLFVVAQFGLRNVYLTLSRRHPYQDFVILRVAGCAVGVGVLTLVGTLMGFSPLLIMAMGMLKVADSVLDIVYARIQFHERMMQLGLLMVANPAMTVIGAALGLWVSGRIEWGVIASAIGSALTLAIGLAMTNGLPASPEPAGTRSERWKDIASAASPIMATQLLVSLLIYTPVWVAQAGGGADAVGVYSGASYLVVFASLVGASIQTVSIPRLRRDHENGTGTTGTVVRSSIKWTVLGLAGAAAAVVAGPAILSWVYGPDFRMGRLDVAMLALAAAMGVPTYLFNAVMLVRNKYLAQSVVALVSVVVALAVGMAATSFIAATTAACLTALVGAALRLAASVVEVLRSERP